VALSFVIDMFKTFDSRVLIGVIVSNDELMMCLHYKQDKNGGKLTNHIPIPIFLANLSNCIKFMAKPIVKLV